MSEEDRLAIVSFSTNARLDLPLTVMNAAGKKQADAILEKMHTEGSTNLWDGIREGMDQVRLGAGKNNKRLAAVLVLTDGVPDSIPPPGYIPRLREYLDKHNLETTLNTFGFGYSLNSALLNDLAITGNGIYAFIPDASFVGTAFVHATSNILTTMSKTAELSIETQNGAIIHEVLGGHPMQKTSWGAQITLPPLQYQQSKDIILRMTLPKDATAPYLSATLKYQMRCGEKEKLTVDDVAMRSCGESERNEAAVHACRCRCVGAIRDGMAHDNLPQTVRAAINDVRACTAVLPDERITGLLQDMEGQVTEAFSKPQYYNKWGKHYLPSLLRAHLLQQCNNFKDPGVQLYGGELFGQLRDTADDLFCKLPPPKPSGDNDGGCGGGGVASMRYYNNSSNPCFAGCCAVALDAGVTKPARDVRRGDVLCSGARVVCVVRTVTPHAPAAAKRLLALPGGLRITPWHPVFFAGAWCFPADLADAVPAAVDADVADVYSYVLEGGATVDVCNVPCSSLAHGVKGDVREHPYWGTDAVLADLRRMPGWDRGLVTLDAGAVVRDPASGLACSLRFPALEGK
eukprot:TRINITY_DN5487_c0_g1_i1.p1 TRINITY_DN5487_c0_g1~~TRINITY_DN5487_c0_g1_i1.p1  ORF type:complete len:573 (-),score=156.86 TRINITY_DN5487_c0_g1_i1:55-1773(-)